MEDIVKNGLDSIRVGLEDFEQAKSKPERLTSAVRNVYAGILILAKGKLYQLSPSGSEGILIRVVKPQLVERQLRLVPTSKTIGYEEIKSRFGHFRLELDWGRVERIGTIRNDLEHFYHRGAASNVQEALADAAPVVRSLLAMLHLDPVRDLGSPWWDILLRNQQLFDTELATCRATLSRIRWRNGSAAAASAHFLCKGCKSPLVSQADEGNEDQENTVLRCAACGADSNINDALEEAVRKQYFAELYEAYTQGGEFAVVHYPECRNEAVVVDPGECIICDYRLGPDTVWCDDCFDPISPEQVAASSHKCIRYADH